MTLEENGSTENSENDLKSDEEKTSPSKKGTKVRKPRKKRAVKDPLVEYEGGKYRGVEIDEDVRMRLLEKHYYALTVAEQHAKICERDLELARLKEQSYRKEIESRLPVEVQHQFAAHTAEVHAANTRLAVARKQYREEAQEVEGDTGLQLKKWLIDDARRMRHVDKLT